MTRPVLDQGQEGRCVEYAICHDLRARPRPKRLDVVQGILAEAKVYHRAQHIDYWAGCSLGRRCTIEPSDQQYEGTSVLAGMKALTELGLAETYRWCFGLDDLMLSISHRGPSVIGVNWYEGCYTPNDKGWIGVEGGLVGGHALVVLGMSLRYRYFTLLNSWGPDWGRNGRAKISFEHMGRLLQEDGECVIPQGLAKAA